jgi:subtilase family serine protease
MCVLGLGIAQSGNAGGVHHTMSLRLEAPETISGSTPSGSGPQYHLFTCQLGLSVGACYDPYQMRRAYGLDSLINAGYDGTGRTIVIIDAFQNPALTTQMAMFDTQYGLPAVQLTQIAPFGLTPFVPGDPNMTGWAEEISLDVAWAHAMAPGAKIILALAKSNQDSDLQDVLQYVVDNNLGDVISMSFGEGETCMDPAIVAAQHAAFAEATLKGITLFASSGDQGAAQPTCDGNSWMKSASTPASDPLVTGVGGTELIAADWTTACTVASRDSSNCPTPNPVPGTYESETAWNEGPPFGDFQNRFAATEATGGGFSVLYDAPPYQKATVKGGQRGVPDVSYNAAILHGVLTYLAIPGVPPGWYRFGGTSAGAPQWSAILAIANQKAGGRLGFLNSAIYQIGKVNKAYPVSFNDITAGTNSAGEFDSNGNPVIVLGFNAGSGWDATTGTGTPIVSGLVDYLIKYVSPGDGQSAVSTTKPKPNPKPVVPGHMDPH